jgi:glycosyltransferase involved in cell wall biosynthesis
MLERALRSVDIQTYSQLGAIVETDTQHLGAAMTRQRGLEQVHTKWVAFLDDDDEFEPYHIESLLEHAWKTDADFVFSWYRVIGGTDPRADEFGKPWDEYNPRQTTITTLVRTELALAVGGFVDPDDDLLSPGRQCAGEDFRFTKRINKAGKIVHLPEKTWRWYHHSSNTSGLPTRW